ncbi:hypothetical protein ABVT43_21110 [Aliikangiella sp. GXAS 311]|uniref:DUF4440 domain-containing protein n=1 Tax=Aliikangiella maris TaxID=3162458 RepID=A0ABV2C0C8_9GAMM
MKVIQKVLLIVMLISTENIFAIELSKEDVDQIHKDISGMYTAFESGDISLFLKSTHSSIYELVGGKANYESMTVSAIASLMEQGIVFHEATLGKPKRLYLAGDNEVCFVPRVSIMEIQGQKMKSTGFMIAIKKKDSSHWKYLDGSGLRKDQGLLWKLLPELSRDVELPANYIEML